MKKIIAGIMCVLCACLLLVGCSKKGEKVNWNDRVNYYQTAYYGGTTTGLCAVVSCGVKEKDFVIDGEIGETVPFCTLTLIPLTAESVKPAYNYVLVGENGKAEGALIKEIFGSAYYADIEKAEELGKIKSVCVTAGEEISAEITLTDKMAEGLDYKAALEIAINECGDKLNAESADGKLPEISLRFAGDKRNSENPCYWYVTIASSVDDFMALLIDPKDGKVLTKKA